MRCKSFFVDVDNSESACCWHKGVSCFNHSKIHARLGILTDTLSYINYSQLLLTDNYFQKYVSFKFLDTFKIIYLFLYFFCLIIYTFSCSW